MGAAINTAANSLYISDTLQNVLNGAVSENLNITNAAVHIINETNEQLLATPKFILLSININEAIPDAPASTPNSADFPT